MSFIDYLFYGVVIVFVLFVLLGLIDLFCFVILWRWRTAIRKAEQRLEEREKRSSFWGTQDTVELYPVERKEMDRLYGAPW